MDKNISGIDLQAYYSQYMIIIQKIITAPAQFYREMPKSGGFVEPLVFMVAMGVVAGLIQMILGIVGIGGAGSFVAALASILLVPVMVVLFSFIGAGIAFLIWKSMGSGESYETAFRCLAYTAAITPITTILNAIPYIGPVFGLVWITYLLVNASTEVHLLPLQKSWIVFGAICAVLVFTSVSSQIAARRMVNKLETFQHKIDKMSPEEAGQAMGEFLKGLEKGKK